MTDVLTDAILKGIGAGAQVDAERRLTLAPLYAPDRRDAHGEYTDAQTLEDAVVQYAKSGNKNLHFQHDDHGNVSIGTVLSVFTAALPWSRFCSVSTTFCASTAPRPRMDYRLRRELLRRFAGFLRFALPATIRPPNRRLCQAAPLRVLNFRRRFPWTT